MRQIFQLLVDVAHEHQKESVKDPAVFNQKVAEIREAYSVMDNYLSDPKSATPKQVGEAMTTADFSFYFGVTISRSFYNDYPLVAMDWRDYTLPDEAPDFRDVSRGRTSETGTLLKRNELGEGKQTSLDQSEIKYHVDEYARVFSISWRTLMNDDMGEIRRFPQKLLRSATRFEAKYVSDLYDNATTQAALTALGTDYAKSMALSVENVMTAYSSFANRKDAAGNPILVTPRYLVTHPTQELKARELLAGIDPTLTAPAMVRATKDLLQWRGDPYIGDTLDWYLFADPKDIAAVTVARLRGYPGPQIYLKSPNLVPFTASGSLGAPNWLTGNFEHGEIEFQVLDIIGGWDDSSYVGVTDYQGIFWSGGGN